MRRALSGISLRTKATVAALAIILAALGTTAAVSVVVSDREIAAEQRRSADAMAHSLASAAELALAVRDDAELARLSSGFLWDRNILFVAFYDESGALLRKASQSTSAWESYESNPHDTDQFLLAEKPVLLSSSDTFDVDITSKRAHALIGHSGTIGKVVVALSTQSMYDAQNRQTMMIGGITLVAACISMLLTYLAVKSWTSRLDTFVAASETIARGDYSQSLLAIDPDEIGRLAGAFEQMRLTVQQRDNELRQFNLTLQQRVEARTADLDAARLTAEQLAVQFKEAGARIQAIFDAAADGIMTIGEDGNIESINSAAEKIFGCGPREALNKNIAVFIPALAADTGKVEGIRASLSGFAGSRSEVTGRRMNDSTFPMEMNVSEVLLAGKPVFTAIVRDVTAIREAQLKLDATNKQLLQASRQAGMAEVATGVLHNVGNVLNSVNVSVTLISERVSKSKAGGLEKATRLLSQHENDLGAYLTSDPSGKQIPSYLVALAKRLQEEQQSIKDELALLIKNIEHIKDIVSMQQTYAGASGIVEKVQVVELIEDALRMNAAALARHDIKIVRNYADKPEIYVDKHKVLQILVNFIRNAKYAMDEAIQHDKTLTLSITRDTSSVSIVVSDNGVGIPQQNLTRIFTHGFTTRKDGHGFGLHSGALAARELGGEILVHSEGVGKGAVFTIKLPLLTRNKSA